MKHKEFISKLEIPPEHQSLRMNMVFEKITNNLNYIPIEVLEKLVDRYAVV